METPRKLPHFPSPAVPTTLAPTRAWEVENPQAASGEIGGKGDEICHQNVVQKMGNCCHQIWQRRANTFVIYHCGGFTIK